MLAYAGSGLTNNGKFTISNYDASLVYSVTGGTVSGNTITVTDPNGSATVTARAPKGLADSSATTLMLHAADQGYTITIGFQCYGNGGGCVNNHCGCGTYHTAAEGWAYTGWWACCEGRSYYWNSYSGSGYTWSGTDYTNGQGEWWKIA